MSRIRKISVKDWTTIACLAAYEFLNTSGLSALWCDNAKIMPFRLGCHKQVAECDVARALQGRVAFDGDAVVIVVLVLSLVETSVQRTVVAAASAVAIVVLVLSLVGASAWGAMVAAAGAVVLVVLVLSLVEAPAWSGGCYCWCSGVRSAGALASAVVIVVLVLSLAEASACLVSDGCC
jgi:hypothetical protein